MPVKHDLYQDLTFTKEDIQQRRAGDNYLDSLLHQYDSADKEVLELESSSGSDDELEKLKKKRLLIKDKIVEQLEKAAAR
ncbi:DUF465 domain-containing protein [Pseudomonas yamanorum]|jgi:uncharacterized protein YdcH (DUF465 family)|uniref:DUF465 domain-containing protein n=1 Tax=Pseudomonas yamanorum TaxID=515393 RepID=A0A7Y8EEV1_9PSED|nr:MULTISPECIES: DUF465 domain-containing protein [Pseudomonas]MCS3418694.1 uncharacterized protein YdcH (DUF465 family) [Pseudomonas sp. BIGb0558]MCS3438414.1 uncharacterized protein YdcH (DUF465 family) [Pseudomonas sp. BIGb0450]NVZ81279.1 DUF465 domain-containing protein [Pseudomonas yamanorum]NWD22410.1 DUF465 domain-containing protein [Pseudomonas yamanorum]NWE13010.1 DUF465 domain-containing protein [Pseudomonas yamanorum]